MKKMKQKKKIENIKRNCDKCKEYFSEYDLDLVNGEWLCRGCEDIVEVRK